MSKNRYNLFLWMTVVILLLYPTETRSQTLPKREVRAVWLTTVGGADWPKTYNAERQKQSLIDIIVTLRKRNFNTVFFQVRPRGDTFYPSQYEPWATELTGTLGKDPGWDPLEFAIEEAHRQGLELHAWINVAKVYTGGGPGISSPLHVIRKNPSWVQQYENEWWLDLGRPEVREYLKNIVMELARMYDLDGIHFDYLRYPGENFNDWSSFRIYSDGKKKDEWRRDNITSFVRDIYMAVIAERPLMKVGSAPVGIYESVPGAKSGFAGYSALSQDSRKWLREKIHDYIVPQLYWDFGEQSSPNDPDFKAACIDWARNRYGRHLYIGIGAYRENIQQEMAEQIELTRSEHTQGQAFFRYEDVVRTGLGYKYPALIPSMPWKDSVPPIPPTNIIVTATPEGARLVHWSAANSAADGDRPVQYAIYRAIAESVDIENPRSLLALVPAADTSFLDANIRSAADDVKYVVTSLDRGNNESRLIETPAVPLAEEAPPPAPAPRQWKTGLAQNSPNPFMGKTYIPYEIAERLPVILILRDVKRARQITLIDETQEPGSYVVAVEARGLPKGKYMYQLRAGAFVDTKYMEYGN